MATSSRSFSSPDLALGSRDVTMGDLRVVPVDPIPQHVERLRRRAVPSPVIDDGAATIAYRGDADAVTLQTYAHRIPGDLPFERVGDDLWVRSLEVPQGSRFEYRIGVTRGARRRSRLDPANPLRARGPFGTNSVLEAAGYRRPWWLGTAAFPRGAKSTFEVADTRTATLYLPHGPPTGALPLLMVHDGSEFLEFTDFADMLDALIATDRIPPVAAVFVDPGDRLAEYAANPDHADFVVTELVPAAMGEAAERGVAVDGNHLVAYGASMGGAAAASTAWRHPHRFRGLISHSGSFVSHLEDRGEEFVPVVRWLEEVADEPRRVVDRAFFSVGGYERLRDDHRHHLPLLRGLAHSARYLETSDAHTWHGWRDHNEAALRFVFDTEEDA